MADNQHLIGIDIGGTKCAVVLGKYNGEEINIINKITFPTQIAKGPEYILNEIKAAVHDLIKDISKSAIAGIGISCGGPLNSKTGTILSPPNLIGWDSIKVVELFEKEFGIKTYLQNDANACALAEWRFGAGRGLENVIFLTFGTGMGAGLILNGKLYSGTNDMAGEVGHIRMAGFGPVGYGKAGSFEGFCSGGGIRQLAITKALERLQMGELVSFCNNINDLESITAKTVSDAAFAGDELAKSIYEISGEYLGKGLAIMIDMLNPEAIIIGSIFTRSRDLLWPAAERVIKAESLSYSNAVCKILPAQLDEYIGDYAALAVALNN
ncbi:MAG: ROK family protein [Mucilaginibacter sp.]|uniref:ROK family protein n=1 Tax=Mucilaginibacter sp. TaxID=1882438 RepID=UPI003264C59D